MSAEQAPTTTDLLCPRCHAALVVRDNRLPESCPACKLLLRAKRQKAYNHNCALVWKKTFTWCGRAPRREFWGFAIIMGGIGVLLALLLDILCTGLLSKLFSTYVYPLPSLPGMLQAVLLGMVGAAIFLWLVLVPLPLFSVTIRRLHDVGHSLLLPLLTLLLAVPGVILPGVMAAFIRTGSQEAETLSPLAALAYFSPLILAGVFSLAILMLCLMDSERGTNKYGPSVKYPLE